MTKVLVAEDDAMLSTVLVRTLLAAGIDARVAIDGFQTVLETKSWHPDVILLDLVMPNKDGFAALREIRADSETGKTPIIVLSNLSGEDTIEQVKKYGITEYLIKAETDPQRIITKVKAMFP